MRGRVGPAPVFVSERRCAHLGETEAGRQESEGGLCGAPGTFVARRINGAVRGRREAAAEGRRGGGCAGGEQICISEGWDFIEGKGVRRGSAVTVKKKIFRPDKRQDGK